MQDHFITSSEGLLAVLDVLFAEECDSARWDSFYANRAKPVPFFTGGPDESLVELLAVAGTPGRALDLGCGNGRNSVLLASEGWEVDAVDHSRQAIDWAAEKACAAGVQVGLHCQSVFEFQFETGAYDLVCDSGCFHHMPPHRRATYIDLVARALRPGGWFGMTCFAPEGGSGLTDLQVYERRSIGYGLGYTAEQLRQLWSRCFDVQTIRRMRKPSAESGMFGEPFLWILFARKAGSPLEF